MSLRVEIELDDQGRLVLPLPLLERLGLVRGSTLIVEQQTADAAYIRVQTPSPMREKNGVLVITSVAEQPFIDIIDKERDQRLKDIWGLDS